MSIGDKVMTDEIKQEFGALAEQIRRGFEANDRQFRVLKTRMAKLELELKGVQKAANRNSLEVLELKSR
jgi:hypothetical protein